MEEGEYKSTYRALTRNRCVFEKALTNNLCQCRLARHFWLADREGYACADEEASAKCDEFLRKLREKSRFVLKLRSHADILPHNMEIRVQAGGISGLALESGEPVQSPVDIHTTLYRALQRYGNLEKIPYSSIIPVISKFKVRQRRRSKSRK